MPRMTLHVLEHAPGEGPGEIANWAAQRGHSVARTQLFNGAPLPTLRDGDWLVIMGGPMNIYEHRNHPWLVPEKLFIRRAIDTGHTVLGVCLGAQLIADVLGGKVYQNTEIEIGWFPVRLTANAAKLPAFSAWPRELTPLHWHGDTFDLPPGAVLLAESDGCRNQAFTFGDHVIGLQFHIEALRGDVEAFIADLRFAREGRYVQTPGQIRDGAKHIPATHAALHSMLDAL
jgi:GMP synthase-like glutamine amidotransferase